LLQLQNDVDMPRNQYAAAEQPSPIRILIADDHRLFAEALQAILVGDPRMEVVGIATTGQDAVKQALALRPDLVLMDISMPGMDGIEATRRLRKKHPTACVIMLTGSDAQQDIDAARKAGAAGYVTKDRIAAELIDQIIEIAS
jgi:DNA-binding NarL/FixJ family response regulator